MSLREALLSRHAAALFDARRALWAKEWARADLALELVEMADPQELRQLCADYVGTSHRTVIRWADKARRFPPEVRDSLYSPRYHPAHQGGSDE